jgi:hypothetical protein
VFPNRFSLAHLLLRSISFSLTVGTWQRQIEGGRRCQIEGEGGRRRKIDSARSGAAAAGGWWRQIKARGICRHSEESLATRGLRRSWFFDIGGDGHRHKHQGDARRLEPLAIFSFMGNDSDSGIIYFFSFVRNDSDSGN